MKAVVGEVRTASALRGPMTPPGRTCGWTSAASGSSARRPLEAASGEQFEAARIILCTGGVSRRLPIPGFELTAPTATPGR